MGRKCRNTYTNMLSEFKSKILSQTYLNVIKAISDKPIANIIFNCEKLKAFHLIS